jgi:hypothetical protein
MAQLAVKSDDDDEPNPSSAEMDDAEFLEMVHRKWKAWRPKGEHNFPITIKGDSTCPTYVHSWDERSAIWEARVKDKEDYMIRLFGEGWRERANKLLLEERERKALARGFKRRV